MARAVVPILRVRARTLRREETDAEAIVWWHVRNRQLNGFKFRRQVPIGPYIADFVCQERRIIVELDGSQHAAACAMPSATATSNASAIACYASGTTRFSRTRTPCWSTWWRYWRAGRERLFFSP